jgi:hypothetical protein
MPAVRAERSVPGIEEGMLELHQTGVGTGQSQERAASTRVQRGVQDPFWYRGYELGLEHHPWCEEGLDQGCFPSPPGDDIQDYGAQCAEVYPVCGRDHSSQNKRTEYVTGDVCPEFGLMGVNGVKNSPISKKGDKITSNNAQDGQTVSKSTGRCYYERHNLECHRQADSGSTPGPNLLRTMGGVQVR